MIENLAFPWIKLFFSPNSDFSYPTLSHIYNLVLSEHNRKKNFATTRFTNMSESPCKEVLKKTKNEETKHVTWTKMEESAVQTRFFFEWVITLQEINHSKHLIPEQFSFSHQLSPMAVKHHVNESKFAGNAQGLLSHETFETSSNDEHNTE